MSCSVKGWIQGKQQGQTSVESCAERNRARVVYEAPVARRVENDETAISVQHGVGAVGVASPQVSDAIEPSRCEMAGHVSVEDGDDCHGCSKIFLAP